MTWRGTVVAFYMVMGDGLILKAYMISVLFLAAGCGQEPHVASPGGSMVTINQGASAGRNIVRKITCSTPVAITCQHSFPTFTPVCVWNYFLDGTTDNAGSNSACSTGDAISLVGFSAVSSFVCTDIVGQNYSVQTNLVFAPNQCIRVTY